MDTSVHKGILALLLAASATAGDQGNWEAFEVFVPDLKERVSPVTGERWEWKILALAPAGSHRYLLLLQPTRMQVSPWSNEQALAEEKQKNLFLGQEHLKKRESRLLLAMFDQRGKLVTEGGVPEDAAGQGGIFPNSWSTAVVMEQAPTCPYGFLDAVGARFYCYDLQLALQKKLDLALHEVGWPGVLLEGQSYWLFFFGRRFSRAPWLQRPGDLAQVKPEVPQTLGYLWRVGDKEAQPLPFSGEELFQAVATLARDPEGRKVSIQKASLGVIPIATWNPRDSLAVLVEAVVAPDYESYVKFEGFRLFFRASIMHTGLGTVKQLPFGWHRKSGGLQCWT